MRKARILLVVGIWVAILPYLGFPYSWKGILSLLTGIGIISFSYVIYRDNLMKDSEEKNYDNFSENTDFNENDSIRTVEERFE